VGGRNPGSRWPPRRAAAREAGPAVFDNARTLFVRNLPRSVTSENLSAFLGGAAAVKECRIVYNKLGKPKGFAYVQFHGEEGLEAALAKDGQTFPGGRNVAIARSKPPQKKQQQQQQNGDGGEKKEGGGEGKAAAAAPKKEEEAGAVAAAAPAPKKAPSIFMPRRLAKKPALQKKPPPGKAGSGAPKSNDDFRKMLLDKK